MAEILHQWRLVVYPIIYRVSYIPGGARFQPVVYPIIYRVSYIPGGARFQPSTVVPLPKKIVAGRWSYVKFHRELDGFNCLWWMALVHIFFF